MPFEQRPMPGQGTPSERARLFDSAGAQEGGVRDPHASKSMEELVSERRQRSKQETQSAPSTQAMSTEFSPTTEAGPSREQIEADQRKIIDDDTKRVLNDLATAKARDEKIRSIDIAPVTQRVPDTLPPVSEEASGPATIPSPSSRVTGEGTIEIRTHGAIPTEQSPGGPASSSGLHVGGSRDLPPYSLSRGPDGEPITNEEPKQNVS